MKAPEGYREIKVVTTLDLIGATYGRDVWTSPDDPDRVEGMKLFRLRDADGNLTGEHAVYVRDKSPDHVPAHVNIPDPK